MIREVITHTRIEGDDRRCFGVERRGQVKGIERAQRDRQREHQPLGAAVDRRRQLGME